eukprot:1023086-Pyramimonas_sp.AAC.1
MASEGSRRSRGAAEGGTSAGCSGPGPQLSQRSRATGSRRAHRHREGPNRKRRRSAANPPHPSFSSIFRP